VTDPDQWLREHRERVMDPREAEQIIADDARRMRMARIGSGVLLASLAGAAAILGSEDLPLGLLGLPAAGAVTGLGFRRASTRTD
jgi:hypothetical protein